MARSGEFGEPVILDVDGFDVRISNPRRPYFSARGETKLDLAEYYRSVGPGIVRALRERPCMLHRFPDGVDGEKVHQKRLPRGAPPWVETVRLHFPRWGLHADELCVTRLADVIWAVQMSTVEFHPWNSRRADTEVPDEWRIDLDPMPDAPYAAVRRSARVAQEVLAELGAVGWPKTSGGKGLHIYVRIAPEYGFGDVRRAALAFAREVERRLPDDITTTWWRKDRPPDAVFVDYNQNARDHTIAAAYSVRGTPEGRVSAPLRWEEIDDAEPGDFTIATMPARFAELGDLHEGIDDAVFSIAPLLEWAERDERAGAAPPEELSETEPLAAPTLARPRTRRAAGASTSSATAARSRPNSPTGKVSTARAARGDRPVFAYIASLPEAERGIAEAVDTLAANTLPTLTRSVKWGMAYYGVGNGWCFSCGSIDGVVSVMFINGTALDPVPPVKPVAMGRATRGIQLRTLSDLDAEQLAAWMRQATSVPGIGRG